jgi:sialate O-acetylesterase
MKKLGILFIINTLIFISCKSSEQKKLSLPSVFSNHMVLQQKANVSIWGNSIADHPVEIKGSWGSNVITIANSKGEWEALLETPSFGGPFELSIRSNEQNIVFSDVMIGEVWLASGQSNMEWNINQSEGGRGIDNKNEYLSANYPEIRMFNIPQDLSGKYLNDVKWLITNPENIEKSVKGGVNNGISATAFFFAVKLYTKLNIPIGIINSSWGGTRVEAWTSHKKLKELIPNLLNIGKRHQFLNNKSKLISYNDSIAKLNNEMFGIKTVLIPDYDNMGIRDWAELDLNDREFSKKSFDDSSWDFWLPKSISKEQKNSGSFESKLDENNQIISDGVIWFRAKINIENIESDFTLIIKNGIDDVDQTYFNGHLIGNTIGWDKARNYKISKKILEKGENSIAIRVYDGGGPGGINGIVEVKNSLTSQSIPFNSFKFKHQAFITNKKLWIHNYSLEDLIKNSSSLQKNIYNEIIFNNSNEYGILFERMISPILPYSIKGAIWYQGEANVSNYNEYQELFSGMIDDWRENWEYNFPFYYAQIAPYRYSNNEFSHQLRDAQRKALESTSKTGMAILSDVGEENDIHPRNKKDVGERLALLALMNDYGFDIVSSGPLYKSHQNFSKYIEVDFKSKGTGLITEGNLSGFEIAGLNGVFHKASAKIINNKVRVSSKKVNNPINVRYGWENWFKGTLFNKEGLPASSFSGSK